MWQKLVPGDRKLELTSCLFEVELLLLKVSLNSHDTCTGYDAVLGSPSYGRASHAYRDLVQWMARDQAYSPGLRIQILRTDGYACRGLGGEPRGFKLEQWSESGDESSSSGSTPASRVDKFSYPSSKNVPIIFTFGISPGVV